MGDLHGHQVTIGEAELCPELHGRYHLDDIVGVVGPARDHDGAGDILDTAREGPGLAKGPVILGEPLDPGPGEAVHLPLHVP